MDSVNLVAKDLPAILTIKNQDTAKKVAAVWLEMLKRSKWQRIEQGRFKEGMKDISLVSHVNSTVEAAVAVSRIITKHHGVAFDEELIIVFGLLHDVDKLVEYEADENGDIVVSRTGKMIQHGVLTAILAHNAGFSEDMVHLILTHTPTQNMKPAFREGILFGYIDLCAWEMAYKFSNTEKK